MEDIQHKRVQLLQELGLSFNLMSNSFVDVNKKYDVPIIDILTYEDDKWDNLITHIRENSSTKEESVKEINVNVKDEKVNDLYFIIKQIKELQEKEKELKKELMPYIKEVEKIDNDLFTMIYRSASTALTFDTTSFKKAYPDLYMEFNSKVRKTAETMAVKIKG